MNRALVALIASTFFLPGASLVTETTNALSECAQNYADGYKTEFDNCVFWTGGNVVADVAAYNGKGSPRTDLAAAIGLLNQKKPGFPGWKENGGQDWPMLSRNFACMCKGEVSVFFGLPFDYDGSGLSSDYVAVNRGKVFLSLELPTLLANQRMTKLIAKGIYGFTQLRGPGEERALAIERMGGRYDEMVAGLAQQTEQIWSATDKQMNNQGELATASQAAKLGIKAFGEVTQPDGTLKKVDLSKMANTFLQKGTAAEDLSIKYRAYMQSYAENCQAKSWCTASYQELPNYLIMTQIPRLRDPTLAYWKESFGFTTDDVKTANPLLFPELTMQKANTGRRASFSGHESRSDFSGVGKRADAAFGKGPKK